MKAFNLISAAPQIRQVANYYTWSKNTALPGTKSVLNVTIL
jgi:hypothetical protein